ncbi:hypothetical protein ABPG77_007693 [Micractinium sp. CCAP 211/92]
MFPACATALSQWRAAVGPRCQQGSDQQRLLAKPAAIRCLQGGDAARPSRRAFLLSAGAASLLLHGSAAALGLRSVSSKAPAVITFRNELDRNIKIYWINYTGDAELYAHVPPAGWFTVDTFESHPWRVVDAASGEILQELVTPPGSSLVRIDPLAVPQARLQPVADSAAAEFVGWDGVGGSEAEYAPASVAEIGLDHLGGVAMIQAEGYPLPVPIAVGINDAAQLFHAAGPEFRRPSTMALWARSLEAAGAQVDRVLITRLVGSTVYARIILSVPGGGQRSLDARPSDSLALAMQTKAPLYIGRRLAASQQPGAPEVVVGDWLQQQPPSPSREGTPPASAQASYRHSRRA